MPSFDGAIVGTCHQFGRPDVVAYDLSKVLDILVKDHDMTREEAIEFYEFNQVGAWVGPDTPVFITLHDSDDLP